VSNVVKIFENICDPLTAVSARQIEKYSTRVGLNSNPVKPFED
jgi:hypothetical protein